MWGGLLGQAGMWLYDQFVGGQDRDEERQRIETARADQQQFADRQANQLETNIEIGKRYGLDPLTVVGSNAGQVTAGSIGATPVESRIGKSQMDFSEFSSSNKKANELIDAQIEGVQLDNIKKWQDVTKGSDPKPVGSSFMPGGSQSVRGPIDVPLERTESYPGKGYMVNGAVPGLAFEVTPTGLAPIPSQDAKNAIEDSAYELRHFYNYGILPNFGNESSKPPKSELVKMFPGATDWEWSLMNQEWRPYYADPRPGKSIKSLAGLGPVPKALKKYFVDYYKQNLKDRVTPRGKYPQGHLFYRGK